MQANDLTEEQKKQLREQGLPEETIANPNFIEHYRDLIPADKPKEEEPGLRLGIPKLTPQQQAEAKQQQKKLQALAKGQAVDPNDPNQAVHQLPTPQPRPVYDDDYAKKHRDDPASQEELKNRTKLTADELYKQSLNGGGRTNPDHILDQSQIGAGGILSPSEKGITGQYLDVQKEASRPQRRIRLRRMCRWYSRRLEIG